MSPSAIADLPGWTVVRSAVSPAQCAAWLSVIDDAYARLDDTPSPDFVPESSSFRLRAIDAIPVAGVWSALPAELHEQATAFLGPRLTIDADQCWVRRQYAAPAAPPRHHPHSWHQDGALGFDFVGHGDAAVPADALLSMVTCWIALTSCGIDAPGLEIVTEPVDHLLVPSDLADAAVDERWPPLHWVRPVLHAGDAVLFSGDVLHRTHVTAAMTRARTSIELRCFAVNAPATGSSG